MAVTLVNPSGDPTPVVVTRLGADSMTFRLPFLSYRARVDAAGCITRLYQPRGTSVDRVLDVDVNQVAKAWAAFDASGKAMGPLSPRDSVSARVGDAAITIRYARPWKRGRVIFGDIVPWDRCGVLAPTRPPSDHRIVISSSANRRPAELHAVHHSNALANHADHQPRNDTHGEPLAGTDYDHPRLRSHRDGRSAGNARPVNSSGCCPAVLATEFFASPGRARNDGADTDAGRRA